MREAARREPVRDRACDMQALGGGGVHGHSFMTPPPYWVRRLNHDPVLPSLTQPPHRADFTFCDSQKPQSKTPSLDTSSQPSQNTAMIQTAPHQPQKWDERLPFDVALAMENSGQSLNDVALEYKITPQQLLEFCKDSVFSKKVTFYRDDIRENGITFRMKARMQAEELLMTSYTLIHDPAVSPAVKADLIKSTVKWAGLEPKANEEVQTQGGGGVSITINMGDSSAQLKMVGSGSSEPITIDQ